MKNQKLILKAFSSLAAMCFAMPALADMSHPTGWYLDGNVGSTDLSGKNYPGNASSSGIGGSADVGYKFMPFFALELGYSRYANTSIKDNTSTIAASDKHYSYDLAARGILPLGSTGFEAFAKLGGGRNCSSVSLKDATAAQNIGIVSSSHSANGIYIGAGLDYFFSPEMGISTQWARANGSSSTGDMDLYSVGFSFLFGS